MVIIMYDNLTYLIKTEILKYDNIIKDLNKKLLMYKPVYDVLKPKGKKFNKENILRLTMDDKFLNMLMKIMEQSNTIVIEKMIENKILYEKHNKQVEESFSSYGLSKEVIFSDTFMNNIKLRSTVNPRLKQVYDKLVIMKQRDIELFELNEKIVFYICNTMIDMYEEANEEKQRIKDAKKYLEYALKNYQSNNNLTPRDKSIIAELIDNVLNLDVKKKLSSEFSAYLSKFNSKTSEKKVSVTKEVPKPIVSYVDGDFYEAEINQEDEDDYIYNNYLIAIKSLDNYNDINTFLNSIKYDCDIKKILMKLMNLLTSQPEDKLLKDYLNEYLSFLSDEKKETKKDENHIFYYGFLNKKNRVLTDVLKGDIPKEYYGDVLKGINMIKTDGAKNKRRTITRIRKVFKLRINDIRITFKKLSNNIYIILGIFCKKDHHGYDVINTTLERNNDLIGFEKSIISASMIQEIWNEYLSINDDFEKELEEVLKVNKK